MPLEKAHTYQNIVMKISVLRFMVKTMSRLGKTDLNRQCETFVAVVLNHVYPSIAEEIRMKLGASSRERRDAARDELKLEREKSSKLRKELTEAMSQIAKLASINEMLLENQVLRAEVSGGNVRRLGKKTL